MAPTGGASHALTGAFRLAEAVSVSVAVSVAVAVAEDVATSATASDDDNKEAAAADDDDDDAAADDDDDDDEELELALTLGLAPLGVAPLEPDGCAGDTRSVGFSRSFRFFCSVSKASTIVFMDARCKGRKGGGRR